MLAAGFALFVINVFWSLRRGAPTGKDPWGGDTLEWSFESAPTVLYPKIPVVSSRHPLWDPGTRSPDEAEAERITQLLDHRPSDFRATIMVDALSGKPQAIVRLATPSYAPLVVATGIMIFTMALIFRLYVLSALGVALSGVGLVYWLWPDRRELERMRTSPLPRQTGLPVLTTGTRSLGWFGLLFLMGVLGWGMATLVYSYFYLRLYSDQWPQEGLPKPGPWLPAAAYAFLAVAAGLVWWARSRFRRADRSGYQLGLTLAVLAVGVFLGLHIYTETQFPFSWETNAYGSIFYLMEWSLDAVVLVGLGLVATAAARAWALDEHWREVQELHAQLAHHYSVFLVGLGAVVFATLYVSPYVL
jgi:heme/copper-type cytochrome/quinol oxidase subunit 3